MPVFSRSIIRNVVSLAHIYLPRSNPYALYGSPMYSMTLTFLCFRSIEIHWINEFCKVTAGKQHKGLLKKFTHINPFI